MQRSGERRRNRKPGLPHRPPLGINFGEPWKDLVPVYSRSYDRIGQAPSYRPDTENCNRHSPRPMPEMGRAGIGENPKVLPAHLGEGLCCLKTPRVRRRLTRGRGLSKCGGGGTGDPSHPPRCSWHFHTLCVPLVTAASFR